MAFVRYKIKMGLNNIYQLLRRYDELDSTKMEL